MDSSLAKWSSMDLLTTDEDPDAHPSLMIHIDNQGRNEAMSNTDTTCNI